MPSFKIPKVKGKGASDGFGSNDSGSKQQGGKSKFKAGGGGAGGGDAGRKPFKRDAPREFKREPQQRNGPGAGRNSFPSSTFQHKSSLPVVEDKEAQLSGDTNGFFASLAGGARNYLAASGADQQHQGIWVPRAIGSGGENNGEVSTDGRGPALLPPLIEDDNKFDDAPKGQSSTSNANAQGGDQLQSKVMWLELGLCKSLIRAVSQLGYFTPTPIQAAAIPVVLKGYDVCARAVTGSGKTAAFVLPILHRLLTARGYKQELSKSKRKYIRGLIIVPSRELGTQCFDMIKKFLQFTTTVEVALVIGGVAGPAQEAALEKSPELVVCTPGRMVDVLMNYKGTYGAIDLSGVEVVAVDEVDKMLTVTIKDQLQAILERTPEDSRQTLLFSATMTKEVDDFANELLVKPRNIEIGHVALQSQLKQQFVRVRGTGGSKFPALPKKAKKRSRVEDGDAAAEDEEKEEQEGEHEDDDDAEPAAADAEEAAQTEHSSKIKARHLVAVCKKFYPRAIIFTKFRTTAHRLAVLFNALGMPSADLQGNQTQEERFAHYTQFGQKKINYLFATDIASRGLDIPNVETVINYDMPPTLTAYIHRVGRTARIGAKGTAVSLVDETEDAEIMRKIIAVSSKVSKHQIATVKRRDVSDADLLEATSAIDSVFSQVKATLATEQLEAKLKEVEKKLMKQTTSGTAVTDGILTSTAKKQWVLSNKEKAKRDQQSLEKYKQQEEVVLASTKEEIRQLDKMEQQRLQKQKIDRKKRKSQQERQAERKREERKAARKQESQKLEKGKIRKEKKIKIRKAQMQKRKAEREASGKRPRGKKESKRRHVNRRKSRVGARKH